MRPPFETFKAATCRGSYVLGTACGVCEKCAWEQKVAAIATVPVAAAKHIESTGRPYDRPLLVQMRYRCKCVGREVLTESCMLDLDMPEEIFIWSMRRLRESILAEVAQHLEN